MSEKPCGAYFFAFFEKFVAPILTSGGLAALTSSFFATIAILFTDADVVHYHAEGPCAMIPVIKFLSKKNIIVTIHGLDWKRAKWGKGFASKFIKFGEKIAVRYADEIIVLSENVKKYFTETYGRETNFIPNGVNKPIKKEVNIIKNKYGLDKDSYFLFLGRLVPEKGVHYLIEAYSKINTDKKLVIAGSASDTESYFKELLDKSKNNKNIIFTGFIQGDELGELYGNAYVYVLPSDLEGMPLTLLEAMSYSNCCIISDIPECTEVIGEQGITFKKSDVEDLSNKLQYVSDDINVVNKFKEGASDYILSKYNWDDVVKETLKLYREINY